MDWGGKMKSLFKLFVVVILCSCTLPMYAGMVSPSSISGVSTATLQTEGEYAGWYLYEIDFQWSLYGRGAGLSHWDLILKDGCAEEDHLIVFDTPAGFSTRWGRLCKPNAMSWTGYFERKGDKSIGLNKPVVKYDGPHIPKWAVAGSKGYGTFWFYSNIVPEYGTYDNVLVAKSGCRVICGDLSGAYPSCTIVPEPATVLMLGVSSMLFIKKR